MVNRIPKSQNLDYLHFFGCNFLLITKGREASSKSVFVEKFDIHQLFEYS
jgi:hypothetical protein